MKKIIMAFLLFSTIILQANSFDDGVAAQSKGDYPTAIKHYRKACADGNVEGCYTLGLMHYMGNHIKKDKSTAVKLWHKACEGGQDMGCFNLGEMYRVGDGVRQNYKTAKELLGQACDLGLQEGCSGYANLNKQGY